MPVDEDPLPPEEIPVNAPIRVYSTNLNSAISTDALVRSYTTNVGVARSAGQEYINYSTFIMAAVSIEEIPQTIQRRKHNRSLVWW